jgi:hypothetical protein
VDDNPYALCNETEKDVSEALDQAGLAFEKLSRARFEAASDEPAGYEYRRWSETLETATYKPSSRRP